MKTLLVTLKYIGGAIAISSLGILLLCSSMLEKAGKYVKNTDPTKTRLIEVDAYKPVDGDLEIQDMKMVVVNPLVYVFAGIFIFGIVVLSGSAAIEYMAKRRKSYLNSLNCTDAN